MATRAPPQKYARTHSAGHTAAKQAMAGASRSTRQKIGHAFGVRSNFDVADISHLMVTIELPLLNGGTFSWSFCDPARLVHYMLDQSPALK